MQNRRIAGAQPMRGRAMRRGGWCHGIRHPGSPTGGHRKPRPLFSWDITYVPSSIRGQYYYMYLCVDVFSRKAVGAEVHAEESMDHSSRLLDTICHTEGVEKHQVSVHADNVGPMKGATMQRLGVMPSVSNDNPFSESLSRTLNYCPLHPTTPLQAWRRPTRRCTFMLRYNDEH